MSLKKITHCLKISLKSSIFLHFEIPILVFGAKNVKNGVLYENWFGVKIQIFEKYFLAGNYEFSFLLTVISLRLTIVRTIQGWIRPKNARSGRFFGFPISCSLLVYYLYYIWNKLYSFFKNIFTKLCTQKVYAQKACAQTCTQKPYAYKRRALKNTSAQKGVRLKRRAL